MITQWCHNETIQSTSNCVSNPNLPVCLSFLLNCDIAMRRSPALIWVSPHVTDSRTTSWMNVYWSCSWEDVYNGCSNRKIRRTLTVVWTIFMRCCLILLMTPDTSTIFSFSTCSRIVSMAMNVPVRPTPALESMDSWSLHDTSYHSIHTHLQWSSMGPCNGLYSCLIRQWKARMGVAYSGTPWSGQEVKWYWVIMWACCEIPSNCEIETIISRQFCRAGG